MSPPWGNDHTIWYMVFPASVLFSVSIFLPNSFSYSIIEILKIIIWGTSRKHQDVISEVYFFSHAPLAWNLEYNHRDRSVEQERQLQCDNWKGRNTMLVLFVLNFTYQTLHWLPFLFVFDRYMTELFVCGVFIAFFFNLQKLCCVLTLICCQFDLGASNVRVKSWLAKVTS